MLRELRRTLLAFLLLSGLTGLVYPLALTGLARLLCPERAGGSLVRVGGIVRGSELVGQDWRGARWFHGRPSASTPPYGALPSGGSNLGPASPVLARLLGERAAALRAEGFTGPLPTDLLCASASGLDPHISPAAAAGQVARVARARALPEERVRALVAACTEGRLLGFLGEPRVNVLRLDLALEGGE